MHRKWRAANDLAASSLKEEEMFHCSVTYGAGWSGKAPHDRQQEKIYIWKGRLTYKPSPLTREPVKINKHIQPGLKLPADLSICCYMMFLGT